MGQGLGDLAEEEAAPTAVVLQDGYFRLAGKKFLPERGVFCGIDTIGHEDEVNIPAGKKFTGQRGIGGADGMIMGLLVFIQQPKNDFEDRGICTDNEDVDRKHDRCIFP